MKPQFVFAPSPLRQSINANGERFSAPVGPTRTPPRYTFRMTHKRFLKELRNEPVFDQAEWEALRLSDEPKTAQPFALSEALVPPRSPSSLPHHRDKTGHADAARGMAPPPAYDGHSESQLRLLQRQAHATRALVYTAARDMGEWRMKNDAAEPIFARLETIIRECLTPPSSSHADIRDDHARWAELKADVERLGGEFIPRADPREMPMLIIRDAEAFRYQLVNDVVAHEHALLTSQWEEW